MPSAVNTLDMEPMGAIGECGFGIVFGQCEGTRAKGKGNTEANTAKLESINGNQIGNI